MMLVYGQIRLDGRTQPRESLDHETVSQYARNMRKGVSTSRLIGLRRNGLLVWDGFHRCMAAVLAKLQEIEVRVTQGHSKPIIK